MAFNWQTFRTRALTAIIFVACMLIGLLWNRWSFFLLFSIIHFGCWIEYLKLQEKIQKISFHPYLKLGFMLCGYGFVLWFAGQQYHVMGYGLRENFSLPVSVAGFVFLVLGIFQSGRITLKAFTAAFLGLIYISLSWGMMIDLYDIKSLSLFKGSQSITIGTLPLVVIAAIWINDTMAYLVGSLIGKTPLSRISPKKTVEGTAGGIILSVIVVSLLSLIWFPMGHTTMVFGLIAFIAAITGTFGDLFESWLKRRAGVKDSGSFMPGHGGFLDRFDSLLIATIFVWLCVTLLGS